MKNYEKPVVMVNDEVAEGVYAASGVLASCWSVSSESVQSWDGASHVFEVKATHSKGVEHTSEGFVVKMEFNHNITNVTSNCGGTVNWSGNVVTLEITGFYDGYTDGDLKEFKVAVSTGEEASTRALAVVSENIYDCGWTINVQGGGANGQ